MFASVCWFTAPPPLSSFTNVIYDNSEAGKKRKGKEEKVRGEGGPREVGKARGKGEAARARKELADHQCDLRSHGVIRQFDT